MLCQVKAITFFLLASLCCCNSTPFGALQKKKFGRVSRVQKPLLLMVSDRVTSAALVVGGLHVCAIVALVVEARDGVVAAVLHHLAIISVVRDRQ